MPNPLIAYCGLNCENCSARIATINDDQELRKKVAKEWSELNQAHITPEMINCLGCRVEGPKTPYCESLCPIRICAMRKGYSTCRDCSERHECPKLSQILRYDEDAKAFME